MKENTMNGSPMTSPTKTPARYYMLLTADRSRCIGQLLTLNQLRRLWSYHAKQGTECHACEQPMFSYEEALND